MLNERLGYDHGQHDASPATLGKTTGSPYLRERYALGDEVHRGRSARACFCFVLVNQAIRLCRRPEAYYSNASLSAASKKLLVA